MNAFIRYRRLTVCILLEKLYEREPAAPVHFNNSFSIFDQTNSILTENDNAVPVIDIQRFIERWIENIFKIRAQIAEENISLSERNLP